MKALYFVPPLLLIIYRSITHSSLTPLGILTATATALLHASHPSPIPFTLLCVFFLAGTTASKVKAEVKRRITLSSSAGGGGGEGPRTHVQVVANSGAASILLLLHLWRAGWAWDSWEGQQQQQCIPTTGSTSGLLLAGITANYAAVAADTLASELGILSQSNPRLITRPWVTVPRGTNGGVTIGGFLAGMLGAGMIGAVSAALMPFCAPSGLGPIGRVLMAGEKEEMYRGWHLNEKLIWVLAVTAWGSLGNVLDSLLGAILQASVIDRRSGKIIEGEGGVKVLVSGNKNTDANRALVHTERNKDPALRKTVDGAEADESARAGGRQESRKLLVGTDYLDNNQVNFLMAASMGLGGMVVASSVWGLSLWSVLMQ